MAALAGSRSEWVDSRTFAMQIGMASVPAWDLAFNYRTGAEEYIFALPLGGLTGLFLVFPILFLAKMRLKSAEYLFLGRRLLEGTTRREAAERETVCRHCGFQELVWMFEHVLIEVESDETVLSLSSTEGYLNSLLIPRKLAIDLREASVTGCTLSPVGGEEPADWYAMRSDHILTPAAFPPGSREHLPYRTSMCGENHAIEPIPKRWNGDICYSRAGFYAKDVNSTHEMFGGVERQGERWLVVSQKVFRLLIGLDKDIVWMGRPVVFVD